MKMNGKELNGVPSREEDKRGPPAAATSTVAEGAQEGTGKSLAEFWDLLSNHDWSYMMSDDPSVNRRGEAAERDLRAIARQGPEFAALHQAWFNFVWNGGEQPPRPGGE